MAEKKAKRKHLKRIVSEYSDDGSVVHHHTYEKKRGDGEEPERRNVAVSSSPEEAGEHVAEQFGMNDQSPQDPGAEQPEEETASDTDVAPAADPTATTGM